jgi:hypothetical protein
VIRTCWKGDYETAQAVIDAAAAGTPAPSPPADRPHEAAHAWAAISGDIRALWALAKVMRQVCMGLRP